MVSQSTTDQARFDRWSKRMKEADRIDRAIFRKEIPPPVKHRLPVGIASIDENLIPDSLKATILAATDWPFSFVGDVGTGKSCTAAWYALQARAFKWMTWSDFCSRSHDVATEGTVSYYDDLNRYCEFSRENWWNSFSTAPLVVIDDLGTGTTTEERDESLWTLLERRSGKPLVLTCNFSMEELQQKFTRRVISRLHLGSSFQFGGADMRTAGYAERCYGARILTRDEQEA